MVADSDFFEGTTTLHDDDVTEDHDCNEGSSRLDVILELLSATPWREALKESTEALRKLEDLLFSSYK